MTHEGLYLDLQRIVDSSLERAISTGVSWVRDHVYIVSKTHRMHTVCSTLEALGYTQRRYGVGERERHQGGEEDESAWSLTYDGIDLYEELRAQCRSRGVKR